MRAAELELRELVTFADGAIEIHGRRLILHSLHAMAQLRADLVRMVGADHARRILTRFGYFHGQAGAALLQRALSWDSLEEWLRAGARLQGLQGAARARVGRLVLPPRGPFRMEVVWHGSGEAEEHRLALGRSATPICWILTGYLSGYASYCLGREVYFIEEACRAAGARACRVVGQEPAAWGAALAPHRPFFQPEDIVGKVRALTRELRAKEAELRRHRRRQLPAVAAPFGVVRSRVFQQLLELAGRVAAFDSPVLLTGESGVGKEVLARYLHQRSPRARGPFVAINCGALPEPLLEAELFGHTAGAFTGAVRDRVGLFAEARGGTVLLDEIGELPAALQVKLLRVLQEREVLRLGENVPRPIDVRILAATNRDLEQEVARGAFRGDLFYRLGVMELHVPALRERPEDILPLARLGVEELARRLAIPGLRLDATCVEPLQRYPWPGNVRELLNALERAAILSVDGRIVPAGLPEAVRAATARGAASREARAPGTGVVRPLAAVEREHIEAVLRHTGGHRGRAARILGIGTSTLWRKLKRPR